MYKAQADRAGLISNHPANPADGESSARFQMPNVPGAAAPRRSWMRFAEPQRARTLLLFTIFLAGGFSLHRIDPDLRRFGELAFPRLWLMAALAVLLSGPARPRRWRSTQMRAAAAFVHLTVAAQLYIALSALWSADNEGLAQRVVAQILLAALLELTWAVLRRAPHETAALLLDLSLAAALVFAAGGLAGGTERGRMAMFFGGPNVFVRVVGGGMVASFYHALRRRRLRALWPLPLLLVCAVESGSRGGLLALLLTLPALAWAVAGSGVLRQRRGWWLALPLLLAVGTALAGWHLFSQPELRAYIEERYLVYAPGAYDPAEADFGKRDVLFAAAFETFRERPLFGGGLAAIGEFERLDAHPHNLFLATARDGGLTGMLLLALAFALLAGRLRRPLEIEQRMAFVLGWFYLAAAQFSGTYYDCRFLWLYFLIVMLPARARPRQPA